MSEPTKIKFMEAGDNINFVRIPADEPLYLKPVSPISRLKMVFRIRPKAIKFKGKPRIQEVLNGTTQG